MTYEEFIEQIVLKIKEKARDMVFYTPGRDFSRVRKICKYDEAIKKAYHIFLDNEDIRNRFEQYKSREQIIEKEIERDAECFINRFIRRTAGIFYKDLTFAGNRLDSIVDELIIDRNRLIDRIGAITSERDSLVEQIEGISHYRDRLNERIVAITSERDSLNEQIDALTSEKDSLNEQIERSSHDRDRLGEIIKDLDENHMNYD